MTSGNWINVPTPPHLVVAVMELVAHREGMPPEDLPQERPKPRKVARPTLKRTRGKR